MRSTFVWNWTFVYSFLSFKRYRSFGVCIFLHNSIGDFFLLASFHCLQSNFAPFTKWKINYTPTKTLAQQQSEFRRGANSAIPEQNPENMRKRRRERTKETWRVTTECIRAHDVTRAILCQCCASFRLMQTKLIALVCECKVNYLYIVSMKQLIKLKMVLFNQTN